MAFYVFRPVISRGLANHISEVVRLKFDFRIKQNVQFKVQWVGYGSSIPRSFHIFASLPSRQTGSRDGLANQMSPLFIIFLEACIMVFSSPTKFTDCITLFSHAWPMLYPPNLSPTTTLPPILLSDLDNFRLSYSSEAIHFRLH